MSQQWWEDDDQLLAALGEALRSERSVPEEFVAMGKAAFAWRGIDAELASLTYDSAFEGTGAEFAGARSEPANLRYLTFTSERFSLEIEVTQEALLGQLVPSGPGQVEVCTADGTVATALIDQAGGFTIRPVPRGSFRLCYQATSGANILTNWVMLRDPPSD